MFVDLQHLATALIAQAAPEARPGGCEGSTIYMPLVMMVILYFVWILPARKERKTHQTMLETLKRGDEVITTSGLLGSISDITDKVITVEIAKNVKVRMLRSAIAKKAEDPKKAEDAKKDAKGDGKSEST